MYATVGFHIPLNVQNSNLLYFPTNFPKSIFVFLRLLSSLSSPIPSLCLAKWLISLKCLVSALLNSPPDFSSSSCRECTLVKGDRYPSRCIESILGVWRKTGSDSTELRLGASLEEGSGVSSVRKSLRWVYDL